MIFAFKSPSCLAASLSYFVFCASYICETTSLSWLFWGGSGMVHLTNWHVMLFPSFCFFPPLDFWLTTPCGCLTFYSSTTWFNWTLRLIYIYIYIHIRANCWLFWSGLSWFVLVCFLLSTVWFLVSSLFYSSSIMLLFC